MQDGGKIITLSDQFDEVLKQAGLIHDAYGEKFVLYSLRHSYRIMALRKGIGIFEVAGNMGTSVEIVLHYCGKQATDATFATRLGD